MIEFVNNPKEILNIIHEIILIITKEFKINIINFNKKISEIFHLNLSNIQIEFILKLIYQEHLELIIENELEELLNIIKIKLKDYFINTLIYLFFK